VTFAHHRRHVLADSEKTGQKEKKFYYGWVIVGVIALAGFANSAETLPVISIFLKPITEDFGWNRSVFTGAITAGTLIGGFFSMATGPIIDRYGPRWVLVISFILLGALLMAMAAISTLWHLYTLQVMARIVAMGAIGLTVTSVVPKWFVSKRGMAVAVSGIGERAGQTITPLYAQLLISSHGWRPALLVTGLVTWAVSIIPSLLFLRRRPEDMGLLPDGATPFDEATSSTVKPTPNPNHRDVNFTVKQVLRLPSFYLLATGLTLMSLPTNGLMFHLVSFLTDREFSAGYAVIVLSTFSTGGAVGSIVFGMLVGRFNIRLTMTANYLLIGIGYIILLTVHSPMLGLAWGFLHGILQGGSFMMQQVIFADYYGRHSLGAIRGITRPAQMTTNAIGPLAAAIAYDATSSYGLVFSIFTVIAVIAAVFIFSALPPAAPETKQTEPS
jgi:MFS family permease